MTDFSSALTRKREANTHKGLLILSVGVADLSFVSFDDGFCDAQPEAAAIRPVAMCSVATEEPLEHTRLLLSRQQQPGIADAEHGLPVFMDETDANTAAFAVMFHRIVGEIEEKLPHSHPIRVHPAGLACLERNGDGSWSRQDGRFIRQVPDQLIEADQLFVEHHLPSISAG